ncbi:hypothetical protein GCM10022224_044010 [Nonomuraea antimicrobica]|uniref:Uncharacterized protein n=1 Tax=Nonomuraea antimicrobica TaxID=561173 RepID=A0ABP7BZZ6_9ACTN
MQETPYYDDPGVAYAIELTTYDANGNMTKFPRHYDNYFVPRRYAFVSVDMIGTRLSDSRLVPYGPPACWTGVAQAGERSRS